MVKPDKKVAVGAGMGGLTAVAAWGFQVGTGIAVPAEVAVGFSTALTFLAQYVVPN